MSLSDLYQQRLLHWALRFKERLEADAREGRAKPGDERELAAVEKIINECRPVLYPPVKVPPGMPKKLD
jgi:hypothetical protein